jgi:hypothetical protein
MIDISGFNSVRYHSDITFEVNSNSALQTFTGWSSLTSCAGIPTSFLPFQISPYCHVNTTGSLKFDGNSIVNFTAFPALQKTTGSISVVVISCRPFFRNHLLIWFLSVSLLQPTTTTFIQTIPFPSLVSTRSLILWVETPSSCSFWCLIILVVLSDYQIWDIRTWPHLTASFVVSPILFKLGYLDWIFMYTTRPIYHCPLYCICHCFHWSVAEPCDRLRDQYAWFPELINHRRRFSLGWLRSVRHGRFQWIVRHSRKSESNEHAISDQFGWLKEN